MTSRGTRHATPHHSERVQVRPPRVTAAEALLGPVAGALIGFAFFAIAAVTVGALLGTGEFAVPDRDWESLGIGASVGAGIVLFLGFLYGGFVAGRLGGAGQRGPALGLGTFLAGVVIALLGAWAVAVGADDPQAQQYAQALRALGVPGDLDGWQDVASTAGVSALLGMLLGSVAGGVLAHRDPHEMSQPAVPPED